MPVSSSLFCHVPGGYFERGVQLSGLTPGAAWFVVQTMLLLTLLPAVFFWMYRRQHWASLTTAGVMFLLVVSELMLADRGSMLQIFVGAVMLFGLPYAVLTVWVELSCLAGQRLRAGAQASLSPVNFFMLAGLVLPVWLSCLFLTAVVNMQEYRMMHFASALMHCLFRLSRPIDPKEWKTHSEIALALPFMLTTTVMLHAWFCRRIGRQQRLSWLLTVIAVSGWLLVVLILGALILAL